MSDLSAADAWEQVRDRLSPEERLRFDMGQDVTVEMTREEYDAIENDPVRQVWQDMGARMGAALDRALSDATPPAPA